jgi:glycosyltransferase involved in cell wall biosynthesis
MGRVSFERAVFRTVDEIGGGYDAVYGHFLSPSGTAAVKLGRRIGIPSFVAVGESGFANFTGCAAELSRLREGIEGVGGVISVSRRNTEFCEREIGVAAKRILTIGNAVDTGQFYPRDRGEMRRKYGLPTDLVLVVFCGAFIERKGPDRVLKAIGGLDGVGGIFVGRGPIKLESNKVVFRGEVDHRLVPELLSAGDIFVLPSREEGSSNVIAEAMACSLPIITSDLPTNRELVGDGAGIFIGADDIEGLRSGVELLAGSETRRREMSEKAVARARDNTLERRVRTIANWMETRIRDKEGFSSAAQAAKRDADIVSI